MYTCTYAVTPIIYLYVYPVYTAAYHLICILWSLDARSALCTLFFSFSCCSAFSTSSFFLQCRNVYKSLCFFAHYAPQCAPVVLPPGQHEYPPPSFPYSSTNITIGTHQWCFIARLGRISLFFFFYFSIFFSPFLLLAYFSLSLFTLYSSHCSSRVLFSTRQKIFTFCFCQKWALFFQEKKILTAVSLILHCNIYTRLIRGLFFDHLMASYNYLDWGLPSWTTEPYTSRLYISVEQEHWIADTSCSFYSICCIHSGPSPFGCLTVVAVYIWLRMLSPSGF
jgi:hypothetical protein